MTNRCFCYLCKEFEGKDHDRRCPYYWSLLSMHASLAVDARSCMVQFEDRCELLKPENNECVGCVECDFDVDVR